MRVRSISERNVGEGEPPSEKVEPTPAVATPKAEPRCLLRSSFCCLSIPAGVRIFAIIDLVAGLVGLASSFFVVVLVNNERAVTQFLEFIERLKREDNSPDLTSRPPDEVPNANDLKQFCVHLLPILVVLNFCYFYFAYNGFLAAGGCVKAAKRYYVWRMVLFVYFCFHGSFFFIITLLYAGLIARSHYIQLNTPQQTLHHNTAFEQIPHHNTAVVAQPLF